DYSLKQHQPIRQRQHVPALQPHTNAPQSNLGAMDDLEVKKTTRIAQLARAARDLQLNPQKRKR
ncbi:MAG: hypothetical protein LW628_15425, partial [Fimbriimonadaceae bacterium]|nr:hypothetical protein [Fimbriimonadaceae bacterium]